MRQSAYRLLILVAVLGFPSAAAATIVDAQLAGKELPEYPWFQYVRAFNPDEPVVAAIDPFTHSEFRGSTCDVYVVEARDAGGWELDPSLVDVTPGGAATFTVGALSIQQNSFVLAQPGELSSDAGIGLGVGYDVVFDCNRNGLLDDGDMIDGRGDEAGLYAVHDTTQPGPLATSTFIWNGGPFRTQLVYYPADIATRGELPLVVVSHGWTLQYWFYDYIGQHLASHGYIVLSHENEVGGGGPAGTLSAAISTLENIDLFLGNLGTLSAGLFDGHVDSTKMTLIGHSTGGEGVIRAYTLLRQQTHPVQHFTADDVVLLSPIAPVAWFNRLVVDPLDVNFHMFGGAADSDVANSPVPPSYTQLMTFLERSTGNKSLVYIHGAGHSYFDQGGQFPWADGPDLIGHAETQTVTKGYLLPLVELYVRNNIAAKDFLTRMYLDFRPMGIAPHVVVAKEYRDAESIPNFVIDDFQTEPSNAISSSGGIVFANVANLEEILMDDTDGSFDWDPAQPSNGMTRAPFSGDDPRGMVMDWAEGTTAFYGLGVVPAQRDFTDDGFLSFRVCQGTRHPNTNSLNRGLTFSVALRDGSNVESLIHFGAYGSITEPYPRLGFGTGAGWANEFSTVRIRLSDFTINDSGIDLTDVLAVRFYFGGSFGSGRGRIGIDDVELTDATPRPFLLSFDRIAGSTSIEWPPTADALDFNLYRGTIPPGGLSQRGAGSAVYDHVCFEASDAFGDGLFVSHDDTAIAPGTAGYYYLVGAVTSSGETLGDQPQRPNPTPCP